MRNEQTITAIEALNIEMKHAGKNKNMRDRILRIPGLINPRPHGSVQRPEVLRPWR